MHQTHTQAPTGADSAPAAARTFVTGLANGIAHAVFDSRSGNVVAKVPFGDECAYITARHIAEALNTAGYRWSGTRLVEPPAPAPAPAPATAVATQPEPQPQPVPPSGVPQYSYIVSHKDLGFCTLRRLQGGVLRFLGAASDVFQADRIVSALEAQAQAEQSPPQVSHAAVDDFATDMLEALRVAHTRITTERDIVGECEGREHHEYAAMDVELEIVEAAMVRASQMRERVRA